MKEILKTEAQKDSANFLLQMLVACALVAALFVTIWQVAIGNLKADSAVVGSVFTMFIVLVNFCFPNSIGAQKDRETIAKLANNATQPGVTIEPPVLVASADAARTGEQLAKAGGELPDDERVKL